MKGYGEYKDSTVAWIGNVPIRWDISPIHRVASLNSGKAAPVEGNKGEYPFAVYGSGGKFKYTNNYIHDGEAVLFGRKGTLGIPIYTKSKFWAVDTVYFALCNHGIASKLLFYIFQIFPWLEHATKTALPSIVGRTVFRSKIPVPPREEQDQIVRYLDAKVGKINKLIRIKQKQIALLKEKKQAIINQAVTKGLDPNAPMKNSGIAWIGQIPEGWEVTTVQKTHLITLGKMLAPSQKEKSYSLEKYVCAKDVHFSGVSTENLKTMWFSEREKALYLIKNGDLLVVEGGAGAGGAAIFEGYEDCYFQNSIHRVRNKNTNKNKFLYYFLFDFVRRGYIDFACNKATIPHFTVDKLKTMPFLYLPEAEEEKIVLYLDTISESFEENLRALYKEIATLTEYRIRLISDVVTGKMDVRGISIQKIFAEELSEDIIEENFVELVD